MEEVKTVQVQRKCIFCEKPNVIEMPEAAYVLWQGDEEQGIAPQFIQNAWPEASADQREMLIIGTCGPCFDKMFDVDD